MQRKLTQFQIFTSLTLNIVPGFKDNYFYILENTQTSEAAVIDPGDANAIINFLLVKNLRLQYIFLTHHHNDHVGGVTELQHKWPLSKIICSPWMECRSTWNTEEIIRMVPEQTKSIWNYQIKTLDVRGHTLDHIAFILQENLSTPPSDAFVGDSLFGAGCGGLFEGTYPQMLQALKVLRSLPDHTRLWCAHEYTLKNLRVAVQLKEQNPAQAQRLFSLEKKIQEKNIRPEDLMTIPLVMNEEKLTNPFLRWDALSLQKAIDTHDELATFTYVRIFRDKF